MYEEGSELESKRVAADQLECVQNRLKMLTQRAHLDVRSIIR